MAVSHKNLFHWLNQLQLTNQIWSIIIVIYSFRQWFGMSHEFRILIKPHGISRKRYQSSRGKLKTRKFLCVRRDAQFLKSCVLSKYYAYITQDARQNESLNSSWQHTFCYGTWHTLPESLLFVVICNSFWEITFCCLFSASFAFCFSLAAL
jgi:hypothetical protein